MAYTNQVELYSDRHMFTNEELSAITPDQIIRYFKYKLYGDGDVNVSDKPLSGSHHTLGKKPILLIALHTLLNLSLLSIIILTQRI